MSDALQLLSERLLAFKVHAFIKDQQAKNFTEVRNATQPGRAALQVDFSENASLLQQDEIQSAYWSHGQVALCTAVGWTDEGTHSYGMTSDNLHHDKYAATTFMEAVIDDMQTKVTTPLTEVDIFSDGASQHFKQKYMFLWAASLLQHKGIRIT